MSSSLHEVTLDKQQKQPQTAHDPHICPCERSAQQRRLRLEHSRSGGRQIGSVRVEVLGLSRSAKCAMQGAIWTQRMTRDALRDRLIVLKRRDDDQRRGSDEHRRDGQGVEQGVHLERLGLLLHQKRQNLPSFPSLSRTRTHSQDANEAHRLQDSNCPAGDREDDVRECGEHGTDNCTIVQLSGPI